MTRDMWLSVALIVILLGVLTLTAIQQLQQEAAAIPLYSDSDQPTGARALTLWLEGLSLEVDNRLQSAFQVPAETDVAFILAPTLPISPGEKEDLREWVAAGGILIVSDHRLSFQSVLPQSFEISLGVLNSESVNDPSDNQLLLQQGFSGAVREVRSASPLLAEPIMAEPLLGPMTSYFATMPEDAFVLLTQSDRPVTIAQPLGAGYLILSTIAWPFANAGLSEPMAPEFVLNLLAISKRPVEQIWFDEWHHGLQLAGDSDSGAGPGSWLRNTAGGRAVLYTIGLIFVAILLSGRRLGRPVPLRSDIVRRAPLEYITAMANMSRRAGHRVHVQRHYHTQLKRGLGERYRLDPSLPDDEYVDKLLGYRPDLNETQVHGLLSRLSKQKLSEAELVTVANEVADLLATTRREDEKE